MQKLSSIFLVSMLGVLFSCAEKREFAELKDSSLFPETEFISTLESQFTLEKNAVYCVTLLQTWDELRFIMDTPILVEPKYKALQTLNNASSFRNALLPNEYQSSGLIEGNLIKMNASFNKSLAFNVALESYDESLKFNNTPVASFGINGYDEFEQINQIEILYYQNDENFIIKLIPREVEHEIIFFKSDGQFTSMHDMQIIYQTLLAIGTKERKNPNESWKYSFKEEDELRIPKFNFNIEHNYLGLVGSFCTAKDGSFEVIQAYQRTAFLLDELGAKIESEAKMMTVESSEYYENPKPKHLIFNRPFYTMLKRTDATNPYFAMFSANAELMIVE
jgi:hypothetical protein